MSEHLRCVWPITDPDAPVEQLHREAVEDLPEVAHRARFKVWRVLSFQVALGQCVPGSGGARLVAVIDCVGETFERKADTARKRLQGVPS
jgi:hypothetical protein